MDTETDKKWPARCTECELYCYCRRIEPTRARLPCEKLLRPAENKSQVIARRQRRAEQHVIECWPGWTEGQAITIVECAAAIGQTISTAQRILKRMVRRGLVIKDGRRGKATLYVRARGGQKELS